MARPSKYSPELRERAVRMVFDHAGGHPSQWAAIRSVAEKIDTLTMAAGITHGAVFHAINKPGRIWGDGMTPGGVVPPYCLC